MQPWAVAIAKEAEQARQQWIKERETLAEKIQKLAVPFKGMLKHLEMEETSIKQTAFQKPSYMKNDQISELQKCGQSRSRKRQGTTWPR